MVHRYYVSIPMTNGVIALAPRKQVSTDPTISAIDSTIVSIMVAMGIDFECFPFVMELDYRIFQFHHSKIDSNDIIHMQRQRRLVKTLSLNQRQQLNQFSGPREDRLYMLQCRISCLFLRDQPRYYKLAEGDVVRVTGNSQQKDYIRQLWMVKKFNSKEIEIIHFKTDLVLTVNDFQARLEVGEGRQDQKFQVIPYKNGYVRIKDYCGNMLRLDGVLETNQYSQRDDSQLFGFKSIGLFDPPSLQQTVLILSDDKVRSLDLVNSSRRQQQQIVLYKKHYRLNQRWRWQFINRNNETKFSAHLICILTGLFVVYSKESGGIMQASYPQQWMVQQTEIKEYIFIKHAKLGEYLSHSQSNKLFFSPTRKSKWYLQNGYGGLYSKRGLNRAQSI